MSNSSPSLATDPNGWFDYFDKSRSGNLDQEELVRALVTTFGGDQNSTRATVVAVWPAFDRDGSGTIDRQEFCGSGGMSESLLAAMQQQQQRGSVAQPQQQARAYVPSVYVPQAPSTYVPPAPSTYVQPSAPPESPQASSSGSSNSEFWTCARCTFINKRSKPVCRACHSPQPNYQAPSTQTQQQPAPFVPPQHTTTQAAAPYVYQPPPATQPQYNLTPTPYQPQPAVQPPPPTSQTNSNIQTFRVLIPIGMQPGQQIKVDTGTTNPPPSIVAIPARSRWGTTPDGKSYFDVQLRKTKPVVIQGSFVASNSSGTNASTTHTQQHSRPSHSQSVSRPSHSPTRPQAPMSHSMPSSYQAPAPSRVNSHAVIWPEHVTSSAKTLVLKERSMSYSGDDAQIKDANGNIVFYVQAELMTMSQRRYLVDTRGQRIGQLRHKKTPGLHPTVYIGTTSDEKKCSVKMSGMLDPFNCNASIYLGEGQKIGKVSGNWRAKKFSITIDGYVVAKVMRKRTMSSMFMGADTYCIDVNPGADVAFVSLIAVALDELYNDDRGGRQGGGGIGGSFGPGW